MCQNSLFWFVNLVTNGKRLQNFQKHWQVLLVVLFIYLTQHCKNWLEKNTKLQIWKLIRSKKLMHDLKLLLFILMTHFYDSYRAQPIAIASKFQFWTVLTVLNFLRQTDDDIISMTHIFQIVTCNWRTIKGNGSHTTQPKRLIWPFSSNILVK